MYTCYFCGYLNKIDIYIDSAMVSFKLQLDVALYFVIIWFTYLHYNPHNLSSSGISVPAFVASWFHCIFECNHRVSYSALRPQLYLQREKEGKNKL